MPIAAIIEPLGLELLLLVAPARAIDRIVQLLLFGRQRAREAIPLRWRPRPQTRVDELTKKAAWSHINLRGRLSHRMHNTS